MNHNMPPAAPGHSPYAGPASVENMYTQLPTGWESPPVASGAEWGGAANGWAGVGGAAPYNALQNFSQPSTYGNTAPGWGTAAPNTSAGWSANTAPTAPTAPGWGASTPNAVSGAWAHNVAPTVSGWNGNTVAAGYGGGYAAANTAPNYGPTAVAAGSRGRLGNALAAAKEGLGRLFNRNESIQRGAPRAGNMALRGAMGKSANVFRAKTAEAQAAWTPERQEKATMVAQKVGKFALGAAVEFGNEFGKNYGVSVNARGRVSVDSKGTLVKEAVKFAVLPGRKAALAKNATQAARNTAKTMAAENRYTQAAFAGAESGGWRGAMQGAASEAGQHAQQYVQEQGGVSQVAANVVSATAARYDRYGSAAGQYPNQYVPQAPNQYPGQAPQPGSVVPQSFSQQARTTHGYALAA